MSRNGSGTYVLPNPAFVAGTAINPTPVNGNFSDIASALTQSISADGQTPLTGAIKFTSGTAAAPGITFASDSTTGPYLSSVGTLGLAAGGTSIATSTSSATTWNLNTTVSGTLTCSSTLAVTGAVALTSATCTVGGNQVSTSWVLLNTVTASGAPSTLNDTTSLTGTYSKYAIVFNNLVPTANAVSCAFRVHSGGTFQTTSYLSSTLVWAAAAGSAQTTGSIALSNASSTDVANGGSGLSGLIYIVGPVTGTSVAKFVFGSAAYAINGGGVAGIQVGGAWNNSAAVDGVQVLFPTTTIASGSMQIYGI